MKHLITLVVLCLIAGACSAQNIHKDNTNHYKFYLTSENMITGENGKWNPMIKQRMTITVSYDPHSRIYTTDFIEGSMVETADKFIGKRLKWDFVSNGEFSDKNNQYTIKGEFKSAKEEHFFAVMIINLDDDMAKSYIVIKLYPVLNDKNKETDMKFLYISDMSNKFAGFGQNSQ